MPAAGTDADALGTYDESPLDRAMGRYAEGQDAAFPVLYEGLSGRLKSFLVRLAGSPAAADDLVQETFMRMHRARGGFSPGAPVVPWAYAIARNAWLDQVRAAKSRQTTPLDDLGAGAAAEPATGLEADSEQAVIVRQTAELIERTLAELPPAQREAFVLLRYEGLSVGEAAAVLGSTQSAIKLRAFRAYEALRAALARAKDGGKDVPEDEGATGAAPAQRAAATARGRGGHAP